MHTSTNPTKNVSHKLMLKFPDASVPQLKTVYKYVEEFQATSFILDMLKAHSSNSVVPTIMQDCLCSEQQYGQDKIWTQHKRTLYNYTLRTSGSQSPSIPS
jgi:hypothetical protein